MKQGYFENKIKKLMDQDPIFSEIPEINESQFEKLKEHIDNVPDLHRLIEDLIEQYFKHIETVPVDYMARYLAYATVIALDQHIKFHKIPIDTKKQKTDTMRNTAIYTFYRVLERYHDWLLEQEDSND